VGKDEGADGADPLVALIALADVLPPASMPAFPEPGVISTLSWSFDLDRLPEEGRRLVPVPGDVREHGGRLLTPGDEPVGRGRRRLLAGRQTVAIFV
jgi:hypothetical protein